MSQNPAHSSFADEAARGKPTFTPAMAGPGQFHKAGVVEAVLCAAVDCARSRLEAPGMDALKNVQIMRSAKAANGRRRCLSAAWAGSVYNRLLAIAQAVHRREPAQHLLWGSAKERTMVSPRLHGTVDAGALKRNFGLLVKATPQKRPV